VLTESSCLFEFADEKTRLSVFDALVLKGKITKYEFEDALLIQKQEDTSDKGAFVDGKPVECINVGGKLFISERIKSIFELNKVHAEYFDARVLIDGKVFGEAYYLFNSQVGIDCLDYDKSQYLREYDDWSDTYNISNISLLVISEKLIPNDIPLFFLGEYPDKKKGNRILGDITLINDALANDLLSANIRGLNIFDIEEYTYDWKWANN